MSAVVRIENEPVEEPEQFCHTCDDPDVDCTCDLCGCSLCGDCVIEATSREYFDGEYEYLCEECTIRQVIEKEHNP